jgi:hypothetical protein
MADAARFAQTLEIRVATPGSQCGDPPICSRINIESTEPELNSMAKTYRIMSFILALALTMAGATGAIYVLFFAAGGYFKTAGASGLILGVGLIWLSAELERLS